MDRRAARVPEALSLENEIAFYRRLSLAERAELLSAVCSAGADLLRANADPERAANFVDPLPPSTVRALARLRAEYRAARDREASLR